MPLRFRSAAAAAASSQDDSSNANPSKLLRLRVGNSQEKAKAALSSLRYCYKICILSVIADLVVVLIDREIYSKVFGAQVFDTWGDTLAIMDTANVSIFARGLGMLSRLYQRLIDKPNELLSDDDAIKLFRTMGIVWTCCTVCLGFVAVGNASVLPVHAIGGPFSAFFETITPSRCILFVLGFLGVANVAIRMYCRIAIARERRVKSDLWKVLTETPAYHSVEHAIGHRTYLSQALCMSSIAALAILDLFKWIISESSHIGRLFSVSDVITPFALAGLLYELNRSFLRTALFSAEKSGDKSREAEVRNALFAAQSGFYAKVADVIKGVTIVRLLPYVAAPIKPYAINIVSRYAPGILEKLDAFT